MTTKITKDLMPPTELQIMIVADENPPTSTGGNSIAQIWQRRDLNTERANTITGASLSSNQITLPAGKYKFQAMCNGWAVRTHKCKLRNITDNTDVAIGNVQYQAPGTGAEQGHSIVYGFIDINDTKVFELQHWTFSAVTNGLGEAAGSSTDTETYSQLEIIRIA
jgi:hypothetical protein